MDVGFLRELAPHLPHAITTIVEGIREIGLPALEKRIAWVESALGIARVESALREGKFMANWKGSLRVWEQAFRGNKSVSSEFVAWAKRAFEAVATELPRTKKLSKWAELAGEFKAVPYVGLGCTILQVLRDDEYDKNFLLPDLLYGLIAFVPEGGWIIEGSWFLIVRPILEQRRGTRQFQDSPLRRPTNLYEIPEDQPSGTQPFQDFPLRRPMYLPHLPGAMYVSTRNPTT